jgi:hypothetical protein
MPLGIEDSVKTRIETAVVGKERGGIREISGFRVWMTEGG